MQSQWDLNAMFFHSVRDKWSCMISHKDMTGQCEDVSIILCLRLCEASSVAGHSWTSENLCCPFGSV